MGGIEGRQLPVSRSRAVRSKTTLLPCVLSGERSPLRAGNTHMMTDRERTRSSGTLRRCTTLK